MPVEALYGQMPPDLAPKLVHILQETFMLQAQDGTCGIEACGLCHTRKQKTHLLMTQKMKRSQAP